MTDVRQVLDRYAAVPERPLDLAAIAQRAQARRRVRHAIQAGVTVATVTVLATALVASRVPARPSVVGDEPEAPLIEAPATSEAVVGPGSPADAAPASPSPSPYRTATPWVSTQVPPPSPAGPVVVPAPPEPTPSATPTRSPATAVEHEGCRVDVPRGWMDTTAGVEPCTYVATRPGGYDSDGGGNWTVTIERGDRTIVYSGEVHAWCGPTGTIQPGDRVTVDGWRGTSPVVTEFGSHTFVAAGSDWGTWC